MWPSDRRAAVQAAQYYFFATFGPDAYATATKKKEVITSKICFNDENGIKVCQ